MASLKTYYYSLTDHKKIQLTYELLFPLVCQMGEFYIAAHINQITSTHIVSRKARGDKPPTFWARTAAYYLMEENIKDRKEERVTTLINTTSTHEPEDLGAEDSSTKTSQLQLR